MDLTASAGFRSTSARSRVFSAVSASTRAALADCAVSASSARLRPAWAACSPLMYSPPAWVICSGTASARSSGSSSICRPERSGRVTAKRVSAAMRNSATAENTARRVSADGPWWKNGGGRRSRVPSGMGCSKHRGDSHGGGRKEVCDRRDYRKPRFRCRRERTRPPEKTSRRKTASPPPAPTRSQEIQGSGGSGSAGPLAAGPSGAGSAREASPPGDSDRGAVNHS